MGLTDALPVLLIVGGSKGARLINSSSASLPELLRDSSHSFDGALDYPEIHSQLSSLPVNWRRTIIFILTFTKQCRCLSSADLVLSRAGASTLGELPHYGLPAILVPIIRWRYQKVNADFLAAKGAAVVIENSNLAEQVMPPSTSYSLTSTPGFHAKSHGFPCLP